MMDMRVIREPSKESKRSVPLQKITAESRRSKKTTDQHVPDLTDFMNDMFFGNVNSDKKAYNLTGTPIVMEDEDDSFDQSTRSNSSRMTQEWLEEARRLVATSPVRGDSPASRHLGGAPRFAAAAAAVPGRLSTSSIDRRDPLSRSARRHRPLDGFSEEILTKSVNHNRNKSIDNTVNSPSEPFPASQVQNWFSSVLNPSDMASSPDPTGPQQFSDVHSQSHDPAAPPLPPRLSTHRRSRFQAEAPASNPQAASIPPRRSFRSSTLPDNQPLSPPKNLIESAHRRSISKSTCSTEKLSPKTRANVWHKDGEGERNLSLSLFLKEQRNKIENLMSGEVHSKAKIILPGPSNSTSSMVAAICYAWWLENRFMKNKGEGDGEGYVVAPVMNIRRTKMWKQRQAAWLFHHVGLDATSLLFADEVDLESLVMAGQLNILVVGQDILRTNGEVGSQCTILTDNYCEDAYDMLQTPELKKLLLAGILLDTQNLSGRTKPTTRDAEAVQLLLVGLAPNYQNAMFDQLIQDQRDNSFFEALRRNYGRPPTENGRDGAAHMESRGTERKSTSASQHEATINNSDGRNARTKRDGLRPARQNTESAPKAAPKQAAADPPRGKNKFFLAKLFGLGSK